MDYALRSPTPRNAKRQPFFYGWIILFVASLAMFISGPGQTYTVSNFVDPIISDLSWSRTMVSGLYTAGSLTGAVLMVLVGKLLDRYGARVILLTVIGLFGFATMFMSRIDHPIELYVGFAGIRTLGQGTLMLASTTMVAVWFVRLRGRAMAIATLGSALSFASFPPLVHFFIEQFEWRGAWIGLSILIWCTLPLMLLARRSPESMGLLPDGATAIDPTGDTGNDILHATSEISFTLTEAMKTRSFWLLLFASMPHSLITTAMVFHMGSLMISRGLATSLAPQVLSIMAVVSLLGTLIAGYLSDKIPNRYLIGAGHILLAVGMVWTFIIGHTWQGLALGAIIGISSGLTHTANNVIWPNYFGRRHLGAIRGVATTGMVAFAAVGPFPFGILFDITGTYTVPLLIFLFLPLACATAILQAYPPKKSGSEDIDSQ